MHIVIHIDTYSHDITSGTRLGYNISASLFVIIIFLLYKIIESIQNFGYGYREDVFRLRSLFYMDDGIILAENQDKMENIINRLYRVCIHF